MNLEDFIVRRTRYSTDVTADYPGGISAYVKDFLVVGQPFTIKRIAIKTGFTSHRINSVLRHLIASGCNIEVDRTEHPYFYTYKGE